MKDEATYELAKPCANGNGREANQLDFLADSASGLDLSKSEDRATFRERVGHRLRATKVTAMREWVGGSMRSRADAVRAVADAYIVQRVSESLGSAEVRP